MEDKDGIMQGHLITFEGVEGSGKTTILHRLANYLEEKKQVQVLTTREPGGVPIAEEIRQLILNPAHTTMDGETEALLYAAARRQHLVEKVLPALQAGQYVLCDRFVDSSLAYQGYARGIGLEAIWQINQFAIGGLLPDLTILFDVDPLVGLARIRANQEREVNRLDLENVEFHQRVYQGYQMVQKRFPDRIVRVDANQPIEQVFAQVRELVEQRFFKKN